jgi:hypothetical protein
VNTYAILRRNGWRTPGDLEEAAARSTAEGDRTRSLGTVCIYQASSPEAIRAHAAADLPVDEIVAVADTVIVRPDPAPAAV